MLTSIAIILFLVIFAVLAYFIFDLTKTYFETQQRMRQLEIQQQRNQNTLTMRLQAYERLMLLCDRISIPNLIARLRTDGGATQDLRFAMLIAIKQEFEHNVTQQIYVSESLWKILQTARDTTADIINMVAQKETAQSGASAYVSELMQFLGEHGDATATAQQAIRQEAASFM